MRWVARLTITGQISFGGCGTEQAADEIAKRTQLLQGIGSYAFGQTGRARIAPTGTRCVSQLVGPARFGLAEHRYGP
jgi:hypothetical protein